MIKSLKNELTTSRLSLVFFALAIALSFKHSYAISIDQRARNQAQAQENRLQQIEQSGKIIQPDDSQVIKGMKQALDRALNPVS